MRRRPALPGYNASMREVTLSRSTSAGIALVLILSFASQSGAQTILSISAFTSLGGEPIAAGAWQSDSDPYFEWVVAGGVPPIAGSSWAVDAIPDCLVDTIVASLDLPAQSDGLHQFGVRAIDSADNCGAVSTFQLAIDSTGDPIGSISAYTEAGGAAILPGVPQSDSDPFMEWTVSAELAPLVGSSWMLDGLPDCLVDTAGTSIQLPAQPDGPHEFRVRAIDTAGNCGPPSVFALAIETEAPPVPVFGSHARIALGAALLLALSLASKAFSDRPPG